MKKIITTDYEVLFGLEAYKILGAYLNNNQYSKLFILTDSIVNECCMPHFLAHLPTEVPFEIIEVEPGEEHKNLETCYSVWQVLTELGADRKSIMITLGGGVVTDLGGFIASVYKRGIDCINVPTTLLGMVDASIGGKTGIDLDGIKNQIGTFSTPKMVVIDTSFLETLDGRQLRSGYAEMLKHGLIYNKEYWSLLKDSAGLSFEDFEDLIFHSVYVKNEVVSQDLKELGIRKILNFGHTLGHAIESYFLTTTNQEPLLHGEAIAMGMILESHISLQKGRLTTDEYFDIKKGISGIFPQISLSSDAFEEVLEWLKHDKKNLKGQVLFVLLDGIGQAVIDQEVTMDLIYKAFEDYSF